MKALARKALLAGSIVAGMSVALAAPAMAEGSWTSSISGAHTGFNSRSWQDNQSDSAATITTLSSCSQTGYPFSSVGIALYDEFGAFPDYRVSGWSQRCGTRNFGTMTRPDGYHFTIETINGQSSNAYPFNAGYVGQSY